MKKIAIFIGAFILSSCARSLPSTFYILDSVNDGKNIKLEKTITVGIDVSVPKYLDRPQIITKINDVEVNLSEFNRWIGPVDEGVARIISENIDRSSKNITVLRINRNRKNFDYAINIVVQRMEGKFGEKAMISVFWQIENNSSQVLFSKTSTYEEKIGLDYDDFVRKLNSLFGKLSSEIALKISNMK